MSDTTTFSLRISNDLLDRIERSATLNGTNRTAYIVSWLPESYDSTAESSADKQSNAQR